MHLKIIKKHLHEIRINKIKLKRVRVDERHQIIGVKSFALAD